MGKSYACAYAVKKALGVVDSSHLIMITLSTTQHPLGELHLFTRLYYSRTHASVPQGTHIFHTPLHKRSYYR